MNSNMRMIPDVFIVTVEDGQGGWQAYGSRKVSQFDLERKMDYYDDYSTFGSSYKAIQPLTPYITVEGTLKGMTVAVGTSRWTAIANLLEAFRQEEVEEAVQAAKLAALNEFGGPVNEELRAKITKWRKKQEEKEFKSRDIYDDHYDNYCCDDSECRIDISPWED